MSDFSLLAYVDPGVGSLLMQALVGGSAGFYIFAKHLWRTYLVSSATRS